MDNDYDVAIVGAGIAGCAAATHYGRRGARVALIERHADPAAYKTVCSTYIQASATAALERLGLAERIEAAGGVRNSLDIWTRWGWIRPPARVEGFTPPYGYNIRRQTLDPMLRELAGETPGVELLLGATVGGLSMRGGRVAGVELAGRDGSRRELRARLVVGADGRGSKVAVLAGVPTRERAHGRLAYMAHYRDLPLSSGSRSLMWMLEPDMAFAFAHDDGVTVLAVMPAKERREDFRVDPIAALERSFADLPEAPAIGGATRVSKAIGKIDMTNQSRRASRPGLALVGDAAMASDPLWGVGCGFAFQSAEWLVELTANALRDERALDRALRRYRRCHRGALALHHWQTADFSTARAYNPIERLMFSAAARDAVSAAHFHAFGARTISFPRFLEPRAVARAAWVNLRARPMSRIATATPQRPSA